MTISISTLRHVPQTSGLSTRELDALLCHLLTCDKVGLYQTPERLMETSVLRELYKLIEQYHAGMPLEYITGYCDFCSMRLKVSPQVLIPRPETEILVETTLTHLKQNDQLLELGTGSGAIAIALMQYTKTPIALCASDVSEDALTLAKSNAVECLQPDSFSHLSFIQSNWFEALPQQRFNIIVSNPPYVAHNDMNLAPNVAMYEPHLALFAGKEGLDCLSTIITQAPHYLNPDGLLILEHGASQEQVVADLMQKAGFNSECITDDAGLPRISIARLAS